MTLIPGGGFSLDSIDGLRVEANGVPFLRFKVGTREHMLGRGLNPEALRELQRLLESARAQVGGSDR